MSGPLPAVLAPLTVPASWLYGAAVAARNRRFDRGADANALSRPVISVGNLTAGGVGKTPMVMWIVDVLRDAGLRPVVAMRGYGAAHAYVSEIRQGDVPVYISHPVTGRRVRLGWVPVTEGHATPWRTRGI